MISLPSARPARVASLVAVLFLLLSLSASAQFTLRPSIGIQSIVFNGDYPASAPISPGTDSSLSFGGGLTSANNAVRIAAELIPDPNGILTIPLSAEYYWFRGKSTFAVPPSLDRRLQQLTFTYDATMLSLGAGLAASFFSGPTLYFSAEGKFNHIFPTRLKYRRFYVNDGTLAAPERELVPDANGQSRIGMALKVGTVVDFFDPVLLDFNIGYGAINLAMKNTDPNTEKNILTAEPSLRSTEMTLGYIGVGLSVIWQM